MSGAAARTGNLRIKKKRKKYKQEDLGVFKENQKNLERAKHNRIIVIRG